ncbi:hypothetical protein AB0G66_33860 [Streptomyces lydicus]
MPRLTGDPELINAVAMQLMVEGFAYVDRSSVRAVSAYQEERDRWLQRRLLLTNEASRRIGTTLDIGRTAQELADVGTDDVAGWVTVDLLASVIDDEGTSPPPGPSLLRRVARYLPSKSRAGVGGDWYDVIPLSGARVALVVGDVVGRGLRAAATMCAQAGEAQSVRFKLRSAALKGRWPRSRSLQAARRISRT